MNKQDRWFVFFVMLTLFCIGGEYAVTRPSSQSIFLSAFSTGALPLAWLATVPLNLLVVALYNHFLPRLGPLRLMAIASFLIVGIHLILAFALPFFPKLIFLQFCWKDIYILLMFKQVWSMIHASSSGTKAKPLYGIIYGMAMCGSLLGSLVPTFFATQFGSEKLFLLTLPIYALLFYAYSSAYRISSVGMVPISSQMNAREGFSLIAKNRYLLGVLLLVVFMQMSVALIEYQFNHHLETAFPVQDVRTEVTGKLFSCISCCSVLLQFIGSAFLLKWVGLRNSHLLIPTLLGLAALGQLFSPVFATVAFAFVFTKTVDFSLFGVLREYLFSPLKLDEKFRAKAVIDIFAYRSSKAVASLVLLGLQGWIGASALFSVVHLLSLSIFCLWIFVVYAMEFKRQLPA